MELMTEHLKNGLILALMLSMPAVLTAASVGLVVGILQAVTQVQEQTIAAAPKILLVFMLIIFGGGTMLTMVQNYIYEAATIAFQEVPASGHYLLPPRKPQMSAKGTFRPQQALTKPAFSENRTLAE